MTLRVLTPSQLSHLVPTLFASHHVVALTPATTKAQWSAQATWMVARAAAAGGRRVLLVDLGLEGADLNDGATHVSRTGIADAFSTDVPLQDVAREQDLPNLFYIGRGSDRSALASVWASERWQKLARGFASEDALLLLAAPPPALASIKIDELALVVLAPEGYAPGAPTFPRIADRLEAGATPLVAVVALEPASRRSQPVPRYSGSARRPRSRAPWFAGIAAAILAIVAGLFLWSRSSGTERLRPSSRPARAVPARPAASLDRVRDSLYYSVQIAAYNTMKQAMAQAAKVEGAGRLAVVTPTRTGTQGVWYRVLVGALPTARAADSLRRRLWEEGTLERPQGTILRTPDAYRLRASREDIPGLRARGVPAYIVLASDLTDLVYVGAFDLAEQARTTDSLLESVDLTGILVRRTGTSQ